MTRLICLLSVTCNFVVSVLRDFLFLWVLGMRCVILLWHFLDLPYSYFVIRVLIDIAILQFCYIRVLMDIAVLLYEFYIHCSFVIRV